MSPLQGPARAGVNIAATVLLTLVVAIAGYSASVPGVRSVAIALPAPSPTPLQPAAASPPPPQPAPSPSAGSARLASEDLSLIDSSTGWTLLSSCSAPTSATCHYSVAGTLDGGKSWGNPVQLGPAFDSTDGSAPRHVRFLNRLDGFVYGFSGAFVTHDGGKSWSGAGLPASFTYDIATGGKTVWAVTSPCGKGVLCRLEVRASLDGGRSWRAPHPLPLGFSPEALVAFEFGVVMSSVPTGDMQITSDGGASWRAIKTQCTGNPFRGYVATFDGHELWELCMGYPDAASNSADKALFVSEDGGRSWTSRATSQPGGGLQQAGWPVWLVSNRADVAFISGIPTSLVTHDAGATWTALSMDVSGIHFAGPSIGWALDATGSIWVTTDGGETWGESGMLPTFPT